MGREPKVDGQARRELFVRGIPSDVTSDDLKAFYSDVAPVRHAVVVRDAETGESRNFGFVAFASADDAQAALSQSSDHTLKGAFLRVELAKPRERKREGASVVKDEVEKRRPRLIIRNVPWSLRDPKELETIFSKFGTVVSAFIPRGPNKRMSGFAFVTMRKQAQAERAIEESKGLEIHGRPVAVDNAVTKEKWENNAKPDEEDASEDEALEKKSGAGTVVEKLSDVDEISDTEEELDDDENDEVEPEEDEGEDDEEQEDKPRRKAISDDQTVFVRNVPYSATEETLEEHFEVFGPVAYALPVMDKKLNQPKGVAFVAFQTREACEKCLAGAPAVASSSLLIPDDVDSRYVYEGRILSISPAVNKQRAENLAEKGAKERLEVLGKAPSKKDKRNLFLLNEGRVTRGSKLAEIIPAAEMQIREKSFELRKKQLNSNPSLHLSMTRLAVRNLPRAMDEKALKALGRKAVVQFATEVKDRKRQPLSKEEVMRSVQHQDFLGETAKSKHGVVKQAKIVQELKGSGQAGRSRGYGFLEMRHHKAALQALRWLNGHLVTKEEIGEDADADVKRRLVVEFAIENAQVLKRQHDRQARSKEFIKKRKAEEQEAEQRAETARAAEEAAKPKGNAYLGFKRKAKKQRR